MDEVIADLKDVKWAVVGEKVLIDPRYLKEYRLKRKRSRLLFVIKSFRVVVRVLRIKHLYNSMAVSWR